MKDVKINQVVQINPNSHNFNCFSGCFLVVTEIKNFGVQGYIQLVGTGDEVGGAAYLRVGWDDIKALNEDQTAPYVLNNKK